MLIKIVFAKYESFYINGDNARLVGVDSIGFLARSRSLENPPQIRRKSSVFRKLVLDAFFESDIGAYHAALLHVPGGQDAWSAPA